MGNTVSAKVIDFTNVKDSAGSFNKKRVPMGDYLAQVTKVEDAKAKSDDTFQYLFTIKLSKYSQYAYPYYCKLTENQLWKLRNLLIAAGINVPKKRVKLDPSKVVGKFIGVTMEDDEYEGKMQSNIAAIFPASELGEADNGPADDEPEDADEDAEEETEDSADEELDEAEEEADEETEEADAFAAMDRNELKVFIREKDTSFRFLKSQTDDDLRVAARGLNAGSDEVDDSDELEELDISDL